MKFPLYLRVLLGAAVVVCGWVFWQDMQSPAPEAPFSPARNDRTAQTLEEERALKKSPIQAQVPLEPSIVDLFAVQSWVPPAPTIINKPVAAQPPPMPFSVSAQWHYLNQLNIVVIKGNGTRYTLCKKCNVAGHIEPGSTFDKGYRLDKLTDSTVELTYLPMHQKTTLYLNKK